MHKYERHIYLASSWENRYLLRAVRDKLTKLGHRVMSRWIDVDFEDYPASEGARRDLEDLDRSDTLVFWPDNLTHKTSGKFVEYGFAIASDHEIFIVEPTSSTCIFIDYQHKNIVLVDTFDDLYKVMEN